MQFLGPTCLAIDHLNNWIYVRDENYIRKFNLDGNFLANVGDQGFGGPQKLTSGKQIAKIIYVPNGW